MVFESGILYKNITAITVAEPFDSTKWEVINFADLFANGTPANDSVVLAQEFGSSTFTRHNERDISRLQSTINEYSTLLTYNVGDQVRSNETNFRNTTAVTAGENFDSVKWAPIDSALSVVHVNDISQFPDATPAIYTHVDDNGLGDARFFFTQPISYTNGQTASLTNGTVPAYDGVRTIDKTPAFLIKNSATIATGGSSSRGVAVNSETNIICEANFLGTNVTFTNGNTNQKIQDTTVGTGPQMVAVDEINNLFFVTNQTGESISVLDGTTFAVTDTISLEAGDQPFGIQVLRTGTKFHLYVSITNTGEIKVFDAGGVTPTYPLIATINLVGTGPTELALNTNENTGYVVDFTDNLLESFDLVTNTLLPDSFTFPGGSQPEGIDVNKTTGKIYVGLFGTDKLNIFENDLTISPVIIDVDSGPIGVVVNEKFDLVFISSQTANLTSVLDGRDNIIIQKITGITGSRAITLNTASDSVIVGSITTTNTTIISVSPTNVANPDNILTGVGSEPGELAINEINGNYYVSLFDAAKLRVYDEFNNFITEISISAFPTGVDIDTALNRIFVSGTGSDTLDVIDGSDNTIIGSPLGTGINPQDVAVHSAASIALVANFNDDDVRVFDTLTLLQIGLDITVGDEPQGIGINRVSQKAYVANHGGSSISVIDVDSGSGTYLTVLSTITTSIPANPLKVAVDETLNRVYVTHSGGTVSIINGSTDAFISSLTVGTSPFGITANSQSSMVYATNSGADTISVINGTDVAVVETIAVGDLPFGIAIHPFSQVLIVTNVDDDDFTVFNPNTFDVTGLTFTTNGSGDTLRTLDNNTGYFLNIPVASDVGWVLPPDANILIHADFASVNNITITGGGNTLLSTLTGETMASLQLRNVDLLDGGPFANTAFDLTGTSSVAPNISIAFFTDISVGLFGNLGTLTNIFNPQLFLNMVPFASGLTLNNAVVNVIGALYQPAFPSVDIFTINNLEDTAQLSTFISISTPVIPSSSVFNINPATPLSNSVVISDSGPAGGGDYFKLGTEETGAITAFAVSGGNTEVTSASHGLVAGQSLEISESINYNGRFAIVGTPGANDFVIARTFVGNDAVGNFTQVKAIETFAANTATVGTVDSTADNGASGTTVTDTAHGLVDGTSVTIAGTTSYNGTFTIFNVTTNTFDIAVAFVGDESGTWVANKTTLTVTAHGFSNGTPILVDETIDYDGGYLVESITADTLVINTIFVTDESTGIVTDASLDQNALNVLVNTVTGVINSKPKASSFVNANATSFTPGSTFGDLTLGTVGDAANEGSDNELWRLTDELTGEMEYRGLEPFSGSLISSISATSSGGDQIFRFRAVKNSGPMVDQIETRLSIGGATLTTSLIVPVTAITGDKIRIQVLREAGGSTLVVDDLATVIQ